MGFESTFILYRKYKEKLTDKEMKAVIDKYAKENERLDYSDSKKTKNEYAKDIPAVLDLQYCERAEKYDEKTQTWIDNRDHSIVGKRFDRHFALTEDGSHLDELLYWNFCSDFTCLANTWNLARGGNHKYDYVVNKHVAEKMLQACNYLLSEKWSDEMEEILNNEWIDVFAEGNSGSSYWKYVYRKNKKRYNELLSDGDDEEIVQHQLKRVKLALETFLKAEDPGRYDSETELILVYTVSL